MATFPSRRRVLQAGAAAGAWLATGAGCGSSRPSYAGFSMSIQSWTFRQFATAQVIAFIDDLGLAYAELYEAHWSISGTPDQMTAMQAELAGHGITCLTHGINPFTADHEANRPVFAFARAAGIRNLLADPPADALDSLEQLAVEYDVRVAIHNHGPGSQYPGIAAVLAALAGRDARIGSCVDTGHYIRAGEDPVAAIHQLAGRLYGVHLKDVASAAVDAPDVILGDGPLDVAGVFRALREVGFPTDAAVSLEYEANPDDPVEDVRAALAVAADAAQASA